LTLDFTFPADEAFTQITLQDVTGKSFLTEKPTFETNRINIPTADIPAGVYFLRVRLSTIEYYDKIIIQH
jgi:hypothetical protein